MDDSPRSSKRRKLTSIHETSSPLPKAPGRLTSRAPSRRKAQVPDTEDEVVKPTPRSSKKRTVPSGKANEDEDVYDDIDGALPQPGQSRAPVRKPKTSPRKRTPKYVIDPTQPHPFKKSAPGAGFDFLIAKTGLSPSSAEFQTLVNGYRRELGMDSGALDELAVENGTPTKSRGSTKARGSAKKANGTPRSSVKKPSATPAKRGVRASQSLAEDGEEEDSADPLQASVATVSNPTRTRSSRKASARVQKSTIEETDDDEPIIATPSKSSNDRVHRHRNRDSPVVQAEEDQEIVMEDTKDGDGEDAMDVDGNSIVGSVLDPTEPSPFNKPSPVVQKQKITPLVQGSFESSRELDLLKTIVMERITGKRPAPLVGLEEEYKTVYQLVEHTITAGEGNSMLLIGARGSGKSALVNKVLTEISKDNNEDYHVVRLNGFIHTDDKIALREIWRQLGKEMDIEEDGGVGKNYADTLTTLLALLSHPDEQAGEFTDQVAKAVIFVMDEFDHFALHPRQTLLYNLFDIAQSRKAPIAVLGLTTRIDVANSLEKRVKSRFSHRYVHLSLAKTFTSFQDMCKSSLIIQADQLSVEERSILTSVPSNTPAKGRKAKSTTHDMLTTWNSNITALFTSKSFLTTHLAPTFYLTKSVPETLTSFLYPTASLATHTHTLSPSTLLTPPDSKLALLPSLSTLALALLIAAARLDIIHDADTCNFNMAYDEYMTLASKARIQSAAGGLSSSGAVSKVWGKGVARREWEGLVELGFIMPVVIGGRGGGFDMVRCDVALEEIGAVLAREKGEKSLERWCRQL